MTIRKIIDAVSVLFLNILNAHFNNEQSECSFCFDADIIEKLIGNMFFELYDEDECSSMQSRALSLFKKSEDCDDMCSVQIKKCETI